MDENTIEINIDKYKPFEIYKKKQLKEDENKKIEEIAIEYANLDDELKLKFIKKAASKYDKQHDLDKMSIDNCFSQHLTHDEHELLLKSYGLPKLAQAKTARIFYAQNYANDYGNYNTKIKEFDTLPDKNTILQAYYECVETHARNYAKFLDELPPERFSDYRKYVIDMENGKHPKNKQVSKQTSNTSTKTATPTRSTSTQKKQKFKFPFEFHYEKHKDEFKNKIDARTAYGKLKDKKKLKYIKKCEEEFDANPYFDDKLLSSFLFKDDSNILFESYGLPKKVPSNLNNFYVQRNYNQVDVPPTERFKICFERLKNLTVDEKNELNREHEEARCEYETKMKEMLERLPARRVPDFESLFGKNSYHTIRTPTKSRTNRNRKSSALNGDTTPSESKQQRINDVNDYIEKIAKFRKEKLEQNGNSSVCDENGDDDVDDYDEQINESLVDETENDDQHDDPSDLKSKATLNQFKSEILSSENDDKSIANKSPRKKQKKN